MDTQKVEEVKDIALKLAEIRVHYPEEYFYLKGWIHCLLQQEDKTRGHPTNLQCEQSSHISCVLPGKTMT